MKIKLNKRIGRPRKRKKKVEDGKNLIKLLAKLVEEIIKRMVAREEKKKKKPKIHVYRQRGKILAYGNMMLLEYIIK